MKQRVTVFLSGIIIFSFLLASCAKKEVSTVLRVGTPPHNGMYNHLYASTTEDMDVCNLIYEGLVNMDADGVEQVNKRLVKNLDISDNGLVYTFRLNEGIQFADGTPLTAEDVLFTYKVLADPSSTAIRHRQIERLKGGAAYISGNTTDFNCLELIDENTIAFNFVKKERTNLDVCDVKILSKAHYPDLEYGNIELAIQEKMKTPLGSGPYIISKFTDGQEVILKRNPTYWAAEDTNYLIDEIVIKFYSKPDLLDALKADEIDLVPNIAKMTELEEIKKWQKSLGNEANLNFISYDSNSYGYLGFNTSLWYSKSSSIRKAIAYGFDREKFVKSYFGSNGETIYASMPKCSELYKQVAGEVEPYEYDPEKAKEILASVNYVWKDDGRMYLENDAVTLTFLATVNSPLLEALIPQFTADMEALGIEVIVENHGYSEIYEILRDPESEWNVFFAEDVWRTDDPRVWANYFSSESLSEHNVTKYENPEVNELLIKGNQAEDQFSADAMDSYKQILIHLNTDLPELPIYTRKETTIADKKIVGLNVGTYHSWSEGLEGTDIKMAETEKD